jgi:hypothetical protein
MSADDEPSAGDLFEMGFDKFIGNLARIFAHRGNAPAVAVLSEGTALVSHWEDYDGDERYRVWLRVPQTVFNSVLDQIHELEEELKKCAQVLMRTNPGVYIDKFVICLEDINDPNWRVQAKSWLRGEGVNNQGRVRSDNIAPYTKDGLLFRSKPEINLYDALNSRGITFAPLPVFLRGGDNYRRLEPDFIVFQGGKVIVIELDGPAFHAESPAEAHERTTMFYWEGAHIERIKASECETPEKAQRVANQIQALIRKLLTNR